MFKQEINLFAHKLTDVRKDGKMNLTRKLDDRGWLI
jgi:hypothetical protein